MRSQLLIPGVQLEDMLLRAHLVSEASESSADLISYEEKDKSLPTCWRGGRPDSIAEALTLLHRRHYSPDAGGVPETRVGRPGNQEPSPLRQAEPKWCPTMPCGQAFSSPVRCTVSGIVAERKKLFEH
uniref:Uncharacterized protein n=1 Tax=Graphocephala atropunctata TaxID=36148 RepID=A0A1B6L2G6_9HEMI